MNHFFEESDILFILDELEGKEREEFIRLEEKQNPLHFKKFREDHYTYFK